MSKTATEYSPVMTHEEREQRRRDIAKYLDSGKTYAEAVKYFKVSKPTVMAAAKEFGSRKIKAPKELTHAQVFKCAAMLVNGSKDAEIARELGVSRERARLLRELAGEAGLIANLSAVVQQAIETGRRQAGG